MSDDDDNDDAQANVIDARLSQSFAFLRDVLANPSLVKIIPAGSLLRHRDVVLGHALVSVRLTAYKSPAQDTWSATIAGFGGTTAQAMRGAERDSRSVVGMPEPPRKHFFVSHRKTAEAALDELEAKLRRALEAEGFVR